MSMPAPIGSLALISKAVKEVTRSTRSSFPSIEHSRSSHSIFEALAIARKVIAKQSATEATNKSSGDHLSPGPPN